MIPQILEALVAYVDAADAKKFSTAQCVLAHLSALVRLNKPELEAAIAAEQKAKSA